jgi:plastocyanin
VVNVQGVQWAWLFNYPQQNVDTVGELVLPVDRNIKFEVTSLDVIHSFWIPAFLMKIDAVPGRTTHFELKPTRITSYKDDELTRVQCAELCGLDHSRMTASLTVVSQDEFDAWIKEQQSKPTPAPTATPGAGAQEVTIVGKNIKFDLDQLTVESGRQVDVTFDNQDAGTPHNWALYTDRAAATSGEAPIAASEIASGPVVQHIVFDAPAPGTYFYRCDVHPTQMTGELVVQ